MNEHRSKVIARYMEAIKEIPNVEPLLPYEPEKYCYQMFGIRTPERDEMMIHLKSRGIATGCHYTPLSIQPLFEPWGQNCPYIEAEHEKFITLPLHAALIG